MVLCIPVSICITKVRAVVVNMGFNEDRGEASEEHWPVSGIRVQTGSSKGQLKSPS